MERLLGEIVKIIQQAIREEMDKNGEPLLLPEELAQKLKVPLSWIYEQSRLGNIPTHRVGRYIRFKLSEVLEHLKREE